MGLQQTLIVFNPSTTIKSADVNSNLANLNGAGAFTVTQRNTLLTGNQDTGFCGFEQCNITNGSFSGGVINWPFKMQNVPSSLTLTMVSASNFGTPSIANATLYGCSISASATATAGQGWWFGTYVTVGNTLWAVEAATRSSPGTRTRRGATAGSGDATFTHHCTGCETVREGLPVRGVAAGGPLEVDTHRGNQPGLTGLAILCPVCGTIEALVTNLRGSDEAGWDRPGMAVADVRVQAHYVRLLCGALGLAQLS